MVLPNLQILSLFHPQFFLNILIIFLNCCLFIFGCVGSLLLCRLFSSCGERRLLFSCGLHGLLVAVDSLVAAASLVAAPRLNSCGTWA